jgi:hypothetical protein
MALSTELRAALANRQRLRPRCRARELPESQPLGSDDPDDVIDPDDSGPHLRKDRNFFPVLPTRAALPPIPPDWSHLLGGRPHSPTSALAARMALLAVGCRLSISSTPEALSEAAGCHDVGSVRRLLLSVYGTRGLSCTYELAGLEQPANVVGNTVTGGNVQAPIPSAAPLNMHDAIEPGLAEAVLQMPRRVQRFLLAPSRYPPPWRSAGPPAGADDGSWCG